MEQYILTFENIFSTFSKILGILTYHCFCGSPLAKEHGNFICPKCGKIGEKLLFFILYAMRNDKVDLLYQTIEEEMPADFKGDKNEFVNKAIKRFLDQIEG